MKSILVVLIILSLAVWLAFDKGWLRQPTDREPTAAPAHQSEGKAIRIIAEGRMATYPGAEITLSSELPAVIARLPIKEKDRIRKGDLIAEL